MLTPKGLIRMSLWQHLAQQISLHTQQAFEITTHNSMSGGCINDAFCVGDGVRQYFVKLNSLQHGDMFETEAQSLDEMSRLSPIRVPRPICSGQTDTQAFLVLEFLPLCGQADAVIFAQQMADMHRVSNPQYGWLRNNTIGSTPQKNTRQACWTDFWRENRLLPQLKLAEKNGYASSLFPLTDRLLSDFDCLFDHYTPEVSMLHGDLWGGNAAGLADGTPVIFDPAFYYGDRETDIAMTHLFGGFNSRFYAAYNEAWPLDEGFKVRKTFYNLYHILNHLNLFGTGYLGQTILMTEQVLAEI